MDTKIFLYSTSGSPEASRLKKVVEALVPKDRIEVFPGLGSLSSRLKRPQVRESAVIAILYVENKKDLNALIAIKDLLSDFPIVMILPDRSDDTVAKGHNLWPRFMTFADSDFVDVAAVLSKMLENDYLGRKMLKHEEILGQEMRN